MGLGTSRPRPHAPLGSTSVLSPVRPVRGRDSTGKGSGAKAMELSGNASFAGWLESGATTGWEWEGWLRREGLFSPGNGGSQGSMELDWAVAWDLTQPWVPQVQVNTGLLLSPCCALPTSPLPWGSPGSAPLPFHPGVPLAPMHSSWLGSRVPHLLKSRPSPSGLSFTCDSCLSHPPLFRTSGVSRGHP